MYSNCWIEAIKAKLRDPSRVRVKVIKTRHWGRHVVWRNRGTTYHFTYNVKPARNEPWWKKLFFNGEVKPLDKARSLDKLDSNSHD